MGDAARPRPLRTRDRRVTVGRVLALALQAALAIVVFRQARAMLRGSQWSELHALGAIAALMTAAVLGLATLGGMLRAALGSASYRIALGVVSGAVALVAGGCALVLPLLSLVVAVEGLRVPGSVFRVSIAASLGSLVTFATGVLFLAAYAISAGLIAVLMLLRSREVLEAHPLVRDIDVVEPWEVGPMPQPAADRPPPPHPVAASERPAAPAPLPRCPCDQVAADVTASESQLAHTAKLDEHAYSVTPPPDDEDGLLTKSGEVRRCATSGNFWWVLVTTSRRSVYPRHEEYGPPLRREIDRIDVGLRCASMDEARALHEWYPRLLEAERAFQAARRRVGSPATADDERAIAEAHEAFHALAVRHPAARFLFSYFDSDGWQPSSFVLGKLRPRLHELVAKLTKQPQDGEAARELAALQRSAAQARARDPHPDPARVELAEIWTADLAPMEALQARVRETAWRAKRDGRGSAAQRELAQLRADVARAWDAFCAHVVWPSPAVEFRFLLDHFTTLDPTAGPDDPLAWERAEELGMRIEVLMRRNGLRPPRDFTVHDWIAKILDLPPNHPGLRLG